MADEKPVYCRAMAFCLQDLDWAKGLDLLSGTGAGAKQLRPLENIQKIAKEGGTKLEELQIIIHLILQNCVSML